MAATAATAAVVLIVLLTGGSGGAKPPEAVAASPSCSFPGSPGPGAIALGRAHFFGYDIPGWKQGDELQLAGNRGHGWTVKQPLEIRGGEPVVLRVPPEARRSVDLVGWGDVGSGWRGGTDRITIDLGADELCQGIWPGGFVITRKQCLHLQVAADGRTARVPFGLGRSCNA